MDWQLENFEDHSQRNNKIDEDLHRNFVPEEKSAKQEEIKETPKMDKAEALKNKWQGDVGEGVTIRVASERLNLSPDFRFDQTNKGIDGVFRDAENNIVLVESKFTKNGIHSLHKDQMQSEWVERTTEKMTNTESEYYTPGNAEIAEEIQEVGASRVRRVVITIHPSTLEAKIHEGQIDKSWKSIDSLKVLDIEQPHLNNYRR